MKKRHEAVHQLGNLTLTTTKLNPSLSNREWPHKKDSLGAHSLLRLTTSSVLSAPEGVRDKWSNERWVECWDEDRIQLRTSWLARIALQAWPKPKGDSD